MLSNLKRVMVAPSLITTRTKPEVNGAVAVEGSLYLLRGLRHINHSPAQQHVDRPGLHLVERYHACAKQRPAARPSAGETRDARAQNRAEY